MASSGWQGEKVIYEGSSSAPRLLGDVNITSISHSGTNLRITGQVQVISPSNSSIYYNGASVWWSGGSTSANLNSNYGVRDSWEFNFDVTISNVSTSTTSYYFSMGVNAVQSGGSVGWTLYFDSSAVAPSGLTTSLVDFGPDWADISVHLGSWGSPSGSASRCIEAAILGTSTYGNPYRHDIRTAVMDATIRVNNSGRGSLVVTPNTQYWYGGYATNKSASTRVVSGQFTTLPAVPVINAIDQGHGVIDVTVTHATEGSALAITEEYSIDGGTTWTAITGGAFTVTLSTQTVLTVRRSSTAGASSDTVTVTPSFTTAIYGSVLNKSVLIDKVYANAPSRAVISASLVTGSVFTAFDSTTFVNRFYQSEALCNLVAQGYSLESLETSSQNGAVWYLVLNFSKDGTETNRVLALQMSLANLIAVASQWGVTISNSYSGASTTAALTGTYGDHPTAVSARKIEKVYGSFDGKTKLMFEDVS